MRDQGGKFQKGHTGNAGGRPKAVAEVRELARAHTVTAIQALVDILSDPATPPAARVAASTAILDRGHGRPAQDVSMKLDGPDIASAHLAALRAMSERKKQPVEDDTPPPSVN